MYLLGIGILLLLLKYFQVGPFAEWSWWWIAVPFVLTAAWWVWADKTGYTAAKTMQREMKRKEERMERQKERLGLAVKRKQR